MMIRTRLQTLIRLCLPLALAAAPVAQSAAADSVPGRVTLPIFSAKQLETSCQQAIDIAMARADRMAAMDIADANTETVLQAWDRAMASANDVLGPSYLLAYVAKNASVREAGEACILKASRLETALFQNPALFERVKAVEPATNVDARLQQRLLHQFEDRGVALPPAKRTRAKDILEQLEALNQEFARNIRDNTQTLTFRPDELGGLPENYLARVKRSEDGGIVVGFDYPDVYPFLETATDADARKRYYRAFQRRGGQRNVEILDEIVALRYEYARLYDLPSYADFVLQRRMAESPDAVQAFLKETAAVIRAAEAKDVQALKALKQAETGKAGKINQWDRSYYTEKLRQQLANIDQESLREYFPTESVQAWILEVSERQYGIRFEKVDVPTWHSDVDYYDIFDATSGEFLSGIYLDLHPRDGKFKHAAAFPVRGSSTVIGRKPFSVLVCNFDRVGLTQSEVETFFHEFGHGLHGVLSNTSYVTLAGTSVERDFVEAPSQMFEAWATDTESLKLLAKHCEGCPAIGDDMISRLDTARRTASGTRYARQHLYASFDMALYDGKPEPAMKVWQALEERTPYGFVAGSMFPGTFSHIAGGYAAGYYGYMWSESIGLDMLTAFGGKLINPEVGARLRQAVLSRGAERPAARMVKDFLGRTPNNAAFFAEIRGEASK